MTYRNKIKIIATIALLLLFLFSYLMLENYLFLNNLRNNNYSVVIGKIIDKEGYHHEDGYYEDIYTFQYVQDSLIITKKENFKIGQVKKEVGDTIKLLLIDNDFNQIHLLDYEEKIKKEQQILLFIVVILLIFIFPIFRYLFFQSSTGRQ